MKKALFAVGMIATLAIGAVQLATDVVADPPLDNCAAVLCLPCPAGPVAAPTPGNGCRCRKAENEDICPGAGTFVRPAPGRAPPPKEPFAGWCQSPVWWGLSSDPRSASGTRRGAAAPPVGPRAART